MENSQLNRSEWHLVCAFIYWYGMHYFKNVYRLIYNAKVGWQNCWLYCTVIMPALATIHKQKRSYMCSIIQGGQGNYSKDCHVFLSLVFFSMIFETNIANANTALLFVKPYLQWQSWLAKLMVVLHCDYACL